jgi:hypothetical protein
MPRREDLPSLTGLRGIAAWLVVIAHTDSFFVAGQSAWLEFAWRVCANLGMTTLFVLSGFVIHYNYGANIAAKGAGDPLLPDRPFCQALSALFAGAADQHRVVSINHRRLRFPNMVLAVSDDDAGLVAGIARRQIIRHAVCLQRVVDQR